MSLKSLLRRHMKNRNRGHRLLPLKADGSMEGHIGSDGWSICEGCGPVREPVFPHSYRDVDGMVTDYYCRHCYRYVEGHSVDEKNHYPEMQYLNVMVSQQITVLNPSYLDWLRERTARRRLIKELWGSDECPTCKGKGRIGYAKRNHS